MHQLLLPEFTFDNTGHLHTVEVQFEPGTPQYAHHHPAVISIYERHLPSWESYGQQLYNDPDTPRTHILYHTSEDYDQI
ncbi:hypothetical protein C8J56DRAFT_1040018 [Mycena floridula]|nr:hypothetical protein C8J56DRAFT_1040018 [Mycena floridula]